MIKWLSFILLFSVSCKGQQTNTVYETLATNSQTTGPTVNVTNVGQVGHAVNVVISNVPAHTCSPGSTITASLQFSYDNSTWVNFGTDGTQPFTRSGFFTYTYQGTGAFPFVRFNMISFSDNTNCRWSIWYSGTLTAAIVSAQGVQNGAFQTNGTIGQAVAFGGVGNTSIATTGSGYYISSVPTMDIAPVITCRATSIVTITAGTTQDLTSAAPDVNATLKICSLVVTGSANGTFQVSVGTGGTCTSPSSATPVFNINTASPLSAVGGYGGYISATPINAGQHICGTATGGNMAVLMTFGVIKNFF